MGGLAAGSGASYAEERKRVAEDRDVGPVQNGVSSSARRQEQ
jgi:hypothetical protein